MHSDNVVNSLQGIFSVYPTQTAKFKVYITSSFPYKRRIRITCVPPFCPARFQEDMSLAKSFENV